MLGVCLGQMAFAQDDTAEQVAKPDTVYLSQDKIDTLPILCNVVNGYGGGEEELLVLNSSTDVQYAFGYNCNFPDVDFSVKTVLYFTISKMCGTVNWKIKTIGNHVIYSVYLHRTCVDVKKKVVSIMIPKIGVNSSVVLDVNDMGNH